MTWLFEKRYQLDDEPLGKGGMGAVYAGVSVISRQKVAVKLIRREMAERTRVRRFEREAIALAAVAHPNIVKLLDCGETDKYFYLVMERASGETLRTLIRRSVRAGKLIDVPTSLFIMEAVARAMIASHKLGIVHRDIKPDNIMIGQGGAVVVLDFGLAVRLNAKNARLTNTNQTSPGAVPGTPRYMAAEQILGRDVDGRTDVYAMGITLYETLSGRTPFDRWEDGSSSTTELWAHHIHASPSDIRDFIDCPPKVCEILNRCIQKRPDDRYPSAAALASALRDAMRDHPLVVAETPPSSVEIPSAEPAALPAPAVRRAPPAPPRAAAPATASMQASFTPGAPLPFHAPLSPVNPAALPRGRGVGFTATLKQPEIPPARAPEISPVASAVEDVEDATIPRGRGVGFTTVLKKPEIPPPNGPHEGIAKTQPEHPRLEPTQRTPVAQPTPTATWVDVRGSSATPRPTATRTGVPRYLLFAPLLGIAVGAIGALAVYRAPRPAGVDVTPSSAPAPLDAAPAETTRVAPEPIVPPPGVSSSGAMQPPAASSPSSGASARAAGAPSVARPKATPKVALPPSPPLADPNRTPARQPSGELF